MIARCDIEKGEAIKYLCGNLVAMTPEEEQDLDLTRRDFSIVMSSRKKTPSLFLGPARFANHDCDANSKLVTTGTDGMQVVAVRDIALNEEITVTYGEDYFGVSNCECLCRSCECEARNGWTSAAGMRSSVGTSATPQAEDQPSGPYLFRRKRKHNLTPGSSASTPDVEDGRVIKKRRSALSSALPTDSSPPTPIGQAQEDQVATTLLGGINLKKDGIAGVSQAATDIFVDIAITAPDAGQLQSVICDLDSTNDPVLPRSNTGLIQERDLLGVTPEQERASEEATLRHDVFRDRNLDDTVTETPQPGSTQLSVDYSDIDSIFEVDLIKTQTPESTPSTHCLQDFYPEMKTEHDEESTIVISRGEITPTKPFKGVEEKDITLAQACEVYPSAAEESSYSDVELSELSAHEEFDDANLCIIRIRKLRNGARKSKASRKVAVPILETPTIRNPGDYERTSLLLSEPFSRWVDCATCQATWVQANGYCTRKECPRCERHSKLYGYQWPKTERLKGDHERVMDHRTVHRFILPEEEAKIRKRGKGLLGGPSATDSVSGGDDGDLRLGSTRKKVGRRSLREMS